MIFRKSKNIDDKTIQKAISELKKGSAQAFHILYQKYQQPIYRFCLRMMNNKEAAEDAFQETFIRVYESSSTFNGTNFSAWLYTVARNTCLNIMRTRKDKVEFDEDYLSPESDKESDFSLRNYIDSAIAKLPVNLREALLLREYEECSYQEIADILGIELSLAKVRVHRARLILKEMLQPLVKEIYESR
jgi:RNA polymerase sigma-70 factor (ECF subfamily)